MRQSSIGGLLTISCVLFGASSLLWLDRPARADEDVYRHRTTHYRHYYRLPRERHVIEAERPPGSGAFLINGRIFTAVDTACWTWTAGDRIALLAGDWHGYCDVAIFRNLRRGGTCAMSC